MAFKSHTNKLLPYFPRKRRPAIMLNEYFSEEKKQTQLKKGNKKKKGLENLSTAKFQVICSLLEGKGSLTEQQQKRQ